MTVSYFVACRLSMMRLLFYKNHEVWRCCNLHRSLHLHYTFLYSEFRVLLLSKDFHWIKLSTINLLFGRISRAEWLIFLKLCWKRKLREVRLYYNSVDWLFCSIRNKLALEVCYDVENSLDRYHTNCKHSCSVMEGEINCASICSL